MQLLISLANDSFAYSGVDNTFTVFKSINNLLYLIYSNKNKSIICYNLINFRKVNEIKNAHNSYITNFRHCLDNNNRRDLILSISPNDNNIKLWNINNWEILVNIKNLKIGNLCSACFLNENNNTYIITNIYYWGDITELIKVFDTNGNKIKEINKLNDAIFFLDTFYDKKLSTNYIITGNIGQVTSFNYNKNEIYHTYCDNDHKGHFSVIINSNSNDDIKLIESSCDGNIRIWGFHSGLLFNKIKVNDNELNGICLWNNDYLFVGCDDNNLKLINLKNKNVIKILSGHNREVLTVKKFIHPNYGECFISQSLGDGEIKIWINKE